MPRVLSIVLLVLCLILPGEVASASRQSAGTPLRIHRYPLPSRIDVRAVYGNTIAWSVGVGPACHHAPCTGQADLYLGHLPRLRPMFVRNVGYIGLLDVDLSARWMVWLAEPYLRPGWSIWARNLRTGTIKLIDRSAKGGGPALLSPSLALSGDTLVWSREDCRQRCTRPGSSSVHLVNLVSGRRTLLATSVDPCVPVFGVSIAPDTIIWTRTPQAGFNCSGNGIFTIVRLDRASGAMIDHTIPVRAGGAPASVHGNGSSAIWTEGGRIRLMNWHTGSIRTIARSGYAPEINQDLAIWENDSGAIYALDLHTLRVIRLAHVVAHGEHNTVPSGPQLGAGRRVIWDETSYLSTSTVFTNRLVVADVLVGGMIE